MRKTEQKTILHLTLKLGVKCRIVFVYSVVIWGYDLLSGGIADQSAGNDDVYNVNQQH